MQKLMGIHLLNRACSAWSVYGRALRGRIESKARYSAPLVQAQGSLGAVRKKSQELEAASMADMKTPQLRLLFGGDEAFPTALSRTRAALKSHPHIRVDGVHENEVRERIHEYDMCVCRMAKMDRATLSRVTRLKLITQFGMGLEGVDVEAATEMGIKVARIPSGGCGNAMACAEHAIYLILSLLRDQKAMTKSVQEGKLGEPEGRTLFGRTVFIVGYGNIGKEMVPRLKPFGVRILAVRPSWNQMYPSSADNLKELKQLQVSNGTDATDNAVDEKGGMEHLHEFLSRADIVVLCCPQTPKTKGMVNEAFLTSMRRGTLLVNVARGGLLDYDAVTAALKSGHLGGLATDVTWVEPIDPKDPIIQHPNVLITPHVAGVTDYSYEHMAEIIANSALQLCEGKEITDLEFVN